MNQIQIQDAPLQTLERAAESAGKSAEITISRAHGFAAGAEASGFLLPT